MNAALRRKIIELFEYRELPKLISYKSGKWNDQFYEDLIQLQYDIYMLDHELETNWEVDMDVVANRWELIHHDLGVLGVDSADYDQYSSHIYKYQKHELEIRKGKLPTRLSMEYFYFYKSCDVKLLRKLIYDRNSELGRVIKTADWRIFDLVTEINDDVTDLQEDTETINGNRFLISLLQYGKARTVNNFIGYLDELQYRNDNKKSLELDGIDIISWTETQINETKRILVDQVDCFSNLDVQKYERILDNHLLV